MTSAKAHPPPPPSHASAVPIVPTPAAFSILGTVAFCDGRLLKTPEFRGLSEHTPHPGLNCRGISHAVSSPHPSRPTGPIKRLFWKSQSCFKNLLPFLYFIRCPRLAVMNLSLLVPFLHLIIEEWGICRTTTRRQLRGFVGLSTSGDCGL